MAGCESNLRQLSLALNLYKNDDGEYPPSTEQWPGLRPYLSNASLTCPFKDMASPNDQPAQRVNYFVNGYGGLGMKPTKQETACRESRGSSFPIAFDANHASPFVARVAGKSFFIYARIDGSVARVDSNMISNFNMNPGIYACPDASAFYNFP